MCLVAPAGRLKTDEEFERAEQAVRALGLRPVFGQNVRATAYGYLAGSDEQRASDFNAALADREIRGIFALRGGYGSMRILETIDYGAVARGPKVVLGYSDLTALLNALYQRTGLVTFHGPVAGLSQFTALEIEHVKRVTMRAGPAGVLYAPQAKALVGGTVRGRIVGGNLSLISAMVGTPYAVETTDALLYIEEVDEPAYRIDRMLTQLRLSGALKRVAGIIIGGLTNCEVSDDVLLDRLGSLGVPIVRDMLIGHLDEQWTIPIGVLATLDAERRTLTIEEPAIMTA